MGSISLAYFWTKQIPKSWEISKLIAESHYANVISTFCLDNPTVRDYVEHGQYSHMKSAPFFIVKRNKETTYYQDVSVKEFFKIADSVMDSSHGETSESLHSSSISRSLDESGYIAGMYASSASSVSRVETDTEENIPSILNVST